MDSAKHCRDQSEECLRLTQSAQSETEARILRDLAHSWVRIANQTERYIAFANRTGQPQPSVSIQNPTGARSFTRSPKTHSVPGNSLVSPDEWGGAGVMRLR
jgi:hypothetical protein